MRVQKIVGVWAVIAILLFWNGAFALRAYKPFLGREAGEMMAAFIAMAVIFGVARAFFAGEPDLPVSTIVRVGLCWLFLTAVLEVGLGQLARVVVPRAAPPQGMWEGPFWALILLSSAAAPTTWLKRNDQPIGRVTK
jgi:hypothetical protein